jgi:hypothetical protein
MLLQYSEIFCKNLKFTSTNNATRVDEWVYLIIVENIYHDEVKDFPMSSKYFHVLYLKSMYYEH